MIDKEYMRAALPGIAEELTVAARQRAAGVCPMCKEQAAYIHYEACGGCIPSIYLYAECESCGAVSPYHAFGKQSFYTEDEAIEHAIERIGQEARRIDMSQWREAQAKINEAKRKKAIEHDTVRHGNS